MDKKGIEFSPLVINIILASLFIVAIISAGMMLAIQNGAEENIGNDTILSDLKDNLVTNLETNYNNSVDASASFENSSITLTGGIPFIDSIYGGWKVIKSAPMTMYTFISGVLFERILGSQASAIILATIISIILIVLIFAVVKFVSTGVGN